jgi:hypothetical protein
LNLHFTLVKPSNICEPHISLGDDLKVFLLSE